MVKKKCIRSDSADPVIEKGVARYDQGEFVGGTMTTDEGFLKTTAITTRTGVFTYKNLDGSLRKELRHPDDVFQLISLNSMKMIPATNNHPVERLVDSTSARRLQVGYTGENIRPDGKFVMAPIVVTDGDVIEQIKNGKNSLSLGYETDIVKEDGEYQGIQYDYRQTNIRYNHIAIVDNARAGESAKIKLDSADAVQEEGCKEHNEDKKGGKSYTNKKTDSMNHSLKKRGGRMATFRLDNIDYEADQEVINHSAKLASRVDTLESNVKTVENERDGFKAKLDSANEELKGLKDHDVKKDIADGVKARVKLVSIANKALKEDEAVKIDSMEDVDIKKAVILAKFPEAKLDSEDVTDAYIDARFDTAVELINDGDENAIAKQRNTVTPRTDSKDTGDKVADSRKNYVNDMQDAWKGDKK